MTHVIVRTHWCGTRYSAWHEEALCRCTDLYHCRHPHDDHCERINIFISQVMETEDLRVSDVCRQSSKAGVWMPPLSRQKPGILRAHYAISSKYIYINTRFGLFGFLFCLFVLNRCSLCSPGLPRAHHIEPSDIQLTETFVSLSLECWS